MRVLKSVLRFLVSRRLWSAVGVLLLCWLIWRFGMLVAVAGVAPFETALARLIAIGVVLILWLLVILLGQLRAARANRVFVAELAKPAAKAPPPQPGQVAVGEIGSKFQGILAQVNRSKLGSRRFLREMPWYLFIGPPGTGKTTALRQSGLKFPIELNEDIKGVGGTRNCDWFFTDQAVLVDTAGRYTEQASHAETDAAEWQGFLDLLRKHRGRRALNGVIVAISLRELLGPREELRAHGREIRKRLAELRERLAIHLPVYLMVTKLDLLPGFESFFSELSTEEREQVWGATLPLDGGAEGATLDRELEALAARLEARLAQRLADDLPLPRRAEIFRFPAQVLALGAPLRLLIDAAFGETRYDEAPWLRGFYLTSATQEGSPVDRLVAELGDGFGIPVHPVAAPRRSDRRSFFLRRFLTDLVFPEAGLGVFDRRAEERRRWIWRGTLAGAVLATACLSALFVFSYRRSLGAVEEQQRRFADLRETLALEASQPASTETPDLAPGLAAMDEVRAAFVADPAPALTALGPRADAEIAGAQKVVYDGALRTLLEPRMVALLEATMWRQVRNPDYLLGAVQTYYMMTGLAPSYDRALAETWWQQDLAAGWVDEAGAAPRIDPFPTEAARDHQVAALDRLATETEKIAPDQELVRAAIASLCAIPLPQRAYSALLSNPAVTGLSPWSPAAVAGPSGPRVFAKTSGRPFQAGVAGAFTYAGFHGTIVPLIPEVAAQALIDRKVFADGCDDGPTPDTAALSASILQLYEQDFVAQWDGFLRDLRLAPLTDLQTAAENIKDLSSADSALRTLLTAVVAETDLTRPEASDEEAAAGAGTAVPARAVKRLRWLFPLLETAAASTGGGASASALPATAGQDVARHFADLKAVVQTVDDLPPKLDEVTAALGVLAHDLQEVLATADPQATLLERGGLPQLIGGVVNASQALPDPIDDWVAGIAGDTVAVTRDAVVAQLNDRLRADVLPFCRTATGGRYPFDATSSIDVTTTDFQRLFGPDGIFQQFMDSYLKDYVDTAVRPWAWRADYGLPAATLQPFEKAFSIQQALFPGGAGPQIGFTLTPKDLSANAFRATLTVDGQVLGYANALTQPMQMRWPGANGSNLVTLSFAPIDNSSEVSTSQTGAWAILRLFRSGTLSPTPGQPDLFSLRLGAGPYSVTYELRAASVENPFDLAMFGGFRCPEGF